MSAYFIAQIDIHDRTNYSRYVDAFDAVLEKYDGEVVVVDDGPVILEGTWNRTRVVVIRFKDQEEARQWYTSPEYQAIARIRHESSEADIILARGR